MRQNPWLYLGVPSNRMVVTSALRLLRKKVAANTQGQSFLLVVTSNQRRGAELEASEIHRELRQRRYTVDLVALAPSKSEEVLDVPSLGKRPLSLLTLWRLRCLTKQYDVVIAYGSRTLPACALALLGTRKRFIYRSIGSPTTWIRSRSHQVRTGLLLRRAQFIVALWEDARHHFIHDFGCREEFVVAIPNLRSPDRFPIPTLQQRSAAREQFRLDASDYVVVIVGALAPEKRVDRAILAVSRHPELKLLVVGDGPLREPLESIADSEANGRITFTGPLNDVVAAYHASDVLLLTSDTEGIPGSLIEAGMTGLPMISVDVGAVRWMSEFTPLLTVVSSNTVDEIAASLTAKIRHRDLTNSPQFREFSTERVLKLWEEFLGSIDHRKGDS